MAERTTQFSARLGSSVVSRLERHAERARTNRSRLAERYLDEAMRMEDHPGIVFRDGPAGRRAGLARGPDVWQVVEAIQATGLRGEAALEAAGDWAGLSPAQMRVAARYYAEFADEIDGWIRRNLEEGDAAEATWRSEQGLLG